MRKSKDWSRRMPFCCRRQSRPCCLITGKWPFFTSLAWNNRIAHPKRSAHPGKQEIKMFFYFATLHSFFRGILSCCTGALLSIRRSGFRTCCHAGRELCVLRLVGLAFCFPAGRQHRAELFPGHPDGPGHRRKGKDHFVMDRIAAGIRLLVLFQIFRFLSSAWPELLYVQNGKLSVGHKTRDHRSDQKPGHVFHLCGFLSLPGRRPDRPGGNLDPPAGKETGIQL